MDKKLTLSVVIINYKTPDLCIDCLQTLLPELKQIDAKVVIVDNASKDDSVKIIQSWIGQKHYNDLVSIITSKKNTGFSGGNNIGINAYHAEYYLLLNSDTLVRPNAIQILLDAIQHSPSAGVVGPRLEWPDTTPQESCFRFHTPVSELIKSAASGPITRLFKKFEVPIAVCNEPACYDWLSFACVLIRADTFKDIGLMDDGYFMYYEDVEFCYRAKQAGWKMLNIPDSHIVHLQGGSSSVVARTRIRKRLPRYYYESRSRFFYQAYGYSGLLLANLFWTVGFLLASVRSVFSSDFINPASACQWRDIWINFFSPLKAFVHPDLYEKS